MFLTGCAIFLMGQKRSSLATLETLDTLDTYQSPPVQINSAHRIIQHMKGMTISCDRIGPGEWDGPHMPSTLDELAALGFNSFAIHPYASIQDNGLVLDRLKDRNDQATKVPLLLAQKKKQIALIKPHLAYWGSRFSWRGAIEFTQANDEKRFFESYRKWIVHMASLCAPFERANPGSVIFCVGTELDQLTKSDYQQGQWFDIIHEIRQVFPGNLTYAANFDDYENIPFWSHLDYIGIQAYFPLSKRSDPTGEDLKRGWAIITNDLRRLQQIQKRPVLFTEIGYARSQRAASHPWEDGKPKSKITLDQWQLGQRLKIQCMTYALKQLNQHPDLIRGFFIWKWFPVQEGAIRDREFLVQYPAMKKRFKAALAPLP